MAWTKIIEGKIDFLLQEEMPLNGNHFFYKADVEKVLQQKNLKCLYITMANIEGESKTVTVLVGVPQNGYDEDKVYKSELMKGSEEIIALACPPIRDYPNGGTERKFVEPFEQNPLD